MEMFLVACVIGDAKPPTALIVVVVRNRTVLSFEVGFQGRMVAG